MNKCPKCGGVVTERKSRSKGAKDRYRCHGVKVRKVEHNEHCVIVSEWFDNPCGLFGIKDIEVKDETL
ncbi:MULTISPECIES: hypothetical protein [Glaesserella]|uniref:Uncharacterized protein n=1 Tax=Glaesserella australis TaxID=2094024 RepID=A0A328BWI6_9PAST|nr:MULTISPECIES: hypothetical protein [Glaesserella]AUI65187.1 hypothetical protein CJD39_00735 [Glaesserella sp. 15-184]RAL18459.1 hypothetical protein C5N92_07025 [Glaesserella australis]